MIHAPTAVVADRRRHPRVAVPGVLRMGHLKPGTTIANAQILDISKGGVSLQFGEPLEAGEHLIFLTDASDAPVHCKVLECQPVDGSWHARCRCVMGGFDLKQVGTHGCS